MGLTCHAPRATAPYLRNLTISPAITAPLQDASNHSRVNRIEKSVTLLQPSAFSRLPHPDRSNNFLFPGRYGAAKGARPAYLAIPQLVLARRTLRPTSSTKLLINLKGACFPLASPTRHTDAQTSPTRSSHRHPLSKWRQPLKQLFVDLVVIRRLLQRARYYQSRHCESTVFPSCNNENSASPPNCQFSPIIRVVPQDHLPNPV